MASLIFRTVDFSSRHPSHFNIDCDPICAGLSPTSTPRSMDSFRPSTSNPFGNSPPTPPPLTLGELAVRFSEQSLCCDDDSAKAFAPSRTSFPHSLPTPPSEAEDCIPNITSSSSTQTSTSFVFPATSQSQPSQYGFGICESITSEPFEYTKPQPSIAVPSATRHNYSYSMPIMRTMLEPERCDVRASDYEDIASPTSCSFGADVRGPLRRKSTPALRQAYWKEAVMEALEARAAASSAAAGLGRGSRSRRLGDESRRRTEECGISKAGRFRRGGMGRRGAISC